MKSFLEFIIGLFSKKDKGQNNESSVTNVVEKDKEKAKEKPVVEEKKEVKSWNFTKEEILKKSGVKYEDLPDTHKKNLDLLVEKINELGKRVPDNLKGSRKCNSGYRSPEDQYRIYKQRAKNKQAPFEDGIYIQSKVPITNHMKGGAIDLNDPDDTLDEWLESEDGKKVVKELDLYIENRKYTKGWAHVQVIRTKSGNRYFIPY